MKKDSLLSENKKLKEQVLKAQNSLALKESLLTEKDSQLKEQSLDIRRKDKLIINLQDAIKLLRRKRFAPSSESSSGQGNLFDELEDIESKVGEETAQGIESESVGDDNGDNDDKSKNGSSSSSDDKKKGKRKKLPEFLPRITTIIEPKEKEQYLAEGIELKCIGEEVTEQLLIIPAKVQVKRTVRKKYSIPKSVITEEEAVEVGKIVCKEEDKEKTDPNLTTKSNKNIFIAPMPEQLLPRAWQHRV